MYNCVNLNNKEINKLVTRYIDSYKQQYSKDPRGSNYWKQKIQHVNSSPSPSSKSLSKSSSSKSPSKSPSKSSSKSSSKSPSPIEKAKPSLADKAYERVQKHLLQTGNIQTISFRDLEEFLQKLKPDDRAEVVSIWVLYHQNEQEIESPLKSRSILNEGYTNPTIASCVTSFGDIRGPFTNVGEKIMNLCHKFNEVESCEPNVLTTAHNAISLEYLLGVNSEIVNFHKVYSGAELSYIADFTIIHQILM